MLKTRILCILLLGMLLCGCQSKQPAETAAVTAEAFPTTSATEVAPQAPAVTSAAPAPLVIPDSNFVAEETFLVWIPMHGGKKYHTTHTCSEMQEPVRVSVETAMANDYAACSRCFP